MTIFHETYEDGFEREVQRRREELADNQEALAVYGIWETMNEDEKFYADHLTGDGYALYRTMDIYKKCEGFHVFARNLYKYVDEHEHGKSSRFTLPAFFDDSPIGGYLGKLHLGAKREIVTKDLGGYIAIMYNTIERHKLMWHLWYDEDGVLQDDFEKVFMQARQLMREVKIADKKRQIMQEADYGSVRYGRSEGESEEVAD